MMGSDIYMVDIVSEAKNRLENSMKEASLTTGKVRGISSSLFKLIDDKSIDNVLMLCEKLLEEGQWALGVIAYDWAYRVKNQYNSNTFFIFERWLKKYVSGWGNCDDFCTHAFGELISQNNDLFTYVLEWTKHQDFWVRRAAAVVLIYPVKQGKYQALKPFEISDLLMNDKHDLVLKGYGWMLKVLSETEPNNVYQYLNKNKNIMPRVSFRYALEKLDRETKILLMKK
jgi:3-methyladenine DNA glycosylase AlkD